jgi:hypothetical protein
MIWEEVAVRPSPPNRTARTGQVSRSSINDLWFESRQGEIMEKHQSQLSEPCEVHHEADLFSICRRPLLPIHLRAQRIMGLQAGLDRNTLKLPWLLPLPQLY